MGIFSGSTELGISWECVTITCEVFAVLSHEVIPPSLHQLRVKSPFIPENHLISSLRVKIPWNWNAFPCRYLWQMFIPSGGKCPRFEWQLSSWSSRYLQGCVLHQMANLLPNIFPECWEKIIPDWMCLEQSQKCLG